jgi:hypothetical protein
MTKSAKIRQETVPKNTVRDLETRGIPKRFLDLETVLKNRSILYQILYYAVFPYTIGDPN